MISSVKPGTSVRRAGGERDGIQLANKGDMAHRESPIFAGQVIVVQRERLLERWCRVGLPRNGHEDGVDVAHKCRPTTPEPLARPLGCWSLAEPQQQPSTRIDRTAGDDDDAAGVDFILTVAFDAALA